MEFKTFCVLSQSYFFRLYGWQLTATVCTSHTRQESTPVYMLEQYSSFHAHLKCCLLTKLELVGTPRNVGDDPKQTSHFIDKEMRLVMIEWRVYVRGENKTSAQGCWFCASLFLELPEFLPNPT